MTETDGTVSYRVKDILGEINAKLARVLEKLDEKADRGDVDDLKQRVTALELRDRLEDDRAKRSASSFTKREKILALVLTAAALFAEPLFHSGVFK